MSFDLSAELVSRLTNSSFPLIFFLFILDGFASFREAFPEWCEDDNLTSSENTNNHGNNHSESLMGLRYIKAK